MAASSADTATGGSATIGATEYHAPEGYLICNGGDIPTSGTFQGVNASLLQNLRSFLGSTYGATGRLPNLINNFAGYSAVPGATGGSKDAIVPYHNHTASTSSTDSGHTHDLDLFRSIGQGGATWAVASGSERRTTNTGFANITSTTTVNYAGTAGNASNANLPPYVGMLPVIKY